MIPTAVCMQCGKECYSWSAIYIEDQRCDCGGELVTIEEE